MPARQQPFKAGYHAAQAGHRAAMLRLAVEENPRFELDLRELERAGPSYTIDSLRELRHEHVGDELCFLVGADTVRDLPSWRDADELPQLAEFVALTRPGVEVRPDAIVSRVVDVPAVGISATHVRDAVKRGQSIRYLVPPGVADYIVRNGLYRS